MSIDLTTLETVEIITSMGLKRVTAHRYQDFAVHLRSTTTPDLFELWTITHLPTGRAVASDFESIDDAVPAMIEIARLRNDWAVMREEDFSMHDLREKVEAIAEKHGGDVGHRNDGKRREPTFNGYSVEATSQ